MYEKIKNILYLVVALILSFILFIVGYCWYCRAFKKIDFPSVFGYSIARVVSGSMQPEINIDDIIIIKKYDDYSVGDIVTYKDGNTYITHRIVDVQSNNGGYITKGDFNNVEDELYVSNDMIQGKVVNHFGSIWNFIEYIWTPHGFGLSIAVVFLFTFIPFIIQTIMNIKKRGGRRLSYSKGYGLFHLVVFVTILSFFLFSGAKVTNVSYSYDSSNMARFTLGIDDSDVISLSMQNLKPGDQKYFEFSVKNKSDDVISQVAQDYNIFIRLVPKDANNILLPLEFSIERFGQQGTVPGVFVDEGDILLDSLSNTGQTSTGKMPTSSDTILHNYRININWPSTEKDYSYANQENKFEIFVKSKQLDVYS